MGSERVARFTRTERVLHWVHAVAFLAMLATGSILYFASLAEAVGRRYLIKNVHLLTAVVWVVALVAVVAFGNRAALRRAWREVQTIDRDDRAWLRLRRAPQGRFNAGQKLNTVITAAFAVLFLISGTFMWLGERDHRLRLDGAGTVHDLLTFASVGLLVGHLYLALVNPSTRHAMRGITRGDVDRDWAERHHAKWVSSLPPTEESKQG